MVRVMKENFQDMYIANYDLMVTYEGQKVTALFMKERIIEKFNNFVGFDGKGYFILGKAFLKNFLAFCATYFVILLQFKLSEE